MVYPQNYISKSRNALLPTRSPAMLERRAKSLVQVFLSRVSSINDVENTLVNLLSDYTMKELDVVTLSPSLTQTIIKVSNEYHHQSSFASLLFLSPPAQSAWSVLFPLVHRYFCYIEDEKQMLTEGCRIELFLSKVLNESLRYVFKTANFTSVGHVFDLCDRWGWELENINLPKINEVLLSEEASRDQGDFEQALKDLRRESIRINGHVFTPPSKGGMRTFVKSLGEALVCPSMTQGATTGDNCSVDERSIATSCSEIDLSSHSCASYYSGYSDVGYDSDCINRKMRSRPIARKRKFDMKTVDKLTSRLILAAGRTQPNGDAYFIA